MIIRFLVAFALLCGAAPALATDRIVNVYDCSGAVTTGAASQVAVAQNAQRDYLFIENPADATEVLYVNYGTSASTTAKNSIELQAGGSINFQGSGVPIQAVNITALTTGHKFICKHGGVF